MVVFDIVDVAVCTPDAQPKSTSVSARFFQEKKKKKEKEKRFIPVNFAVRPPTAFVKIRILLDLMSRWMMFFLWMNVSAENISIARPFFFLSVKNKHLYLVPFFAVKFSISPLCRTCDSDFLCT